MTPETLEYQNLRKRINLKPIERARLHKLRNRQFRRDICAFLIAYAVLITALMIFSTIVSADCGQRAQRCAVVES